MLTVLGNGWHSLLALRVSHPVIYKFMLSVQFLFLAISFFKEDVERNISEIFVQKVALF